MTFINNKILLLARSCRVLLAVACFCVIHTQAAAQQQPPKPISIQVSPGQGLNFGAFFQGSAGGTVIIYSDGSRSVTGNVIQANLGFTYSAATFQVTANVGTLVTILNGPDVSLTGTNGGSMSLHLGTANTGSPFVCTTSQTNVRIGGTLTVGSPLANPSGSYSGIFQVTFIQQ